jgi:nicotinate phosphoribosyltransferase
VGTNLVTGGNEAAFSGVYKLSSIASGASEKAVMKFSDNPEKSTEPGRKTLYRLYNESDNARVDLITLDDEVLEAGKEVVAHHPSGDYRKLSIVPSRVEPLLSTVMEAGRRVGPQPSLKDSQTYFAAKIGSFDSTYLRQLNPHVYKVSISEKLRDLKLGLIRKYLKKY